GFGDEVLVLAFELDRLLNDRHRDFQEGRRRLNQFIAMDSTVSILGKLLQDMPHASLRPDHRVPGNPQPLSEGVCCLEANAVDVQGEPIGVAAQKHPQLCSKTSYRLSSCSLRISQAFCSHLVRTCSDYGENSSKTSLCAHIP